MNVLLTLVVSVLVFGVVIFVHELGHFVAARRSGIAVLEFSIGMGPALFRWERHGTLYSVRALPVGGFVSMEGEDGLEEEEEPGSDPEQEPLSAAEGVPFTEAPARRRAVVLAAGAFMNLVLGFVLLVVLVSSQECIVSRQISHIAEGALCGQTGLQENDTILAVNGRPVFIANDIIYELSRTSDYSADFTVRREGEKVLLPNVQFDTVEDENGKVHMQMGFTVYPGEKTLLSVLEEAVRSTAYYGRIVVSSVADMVAGRVSVNDLSGPVGIVSAIGEAVGYGWQDVFNLAALITINLAVMNLLPLPALDGGKLLILAVEAVLRRPVPTKVQGALNAVGMAMLLSLMLFATWQDILRLV